MVPKFVRQYKSKDKNEEASFWCEHNTNILAPRKRGRGQQQCPTLREWDWCCLRHTCDASHQGAAGGTESQHRGGTECQQGAAGGTECQHQGTAGGTESQHREGSALSLSTRGTESQQGAAKGTECQHQRHWISAGSSRGHWVSAPGGTESQHQWALSVSREQLRALSLSTGGTECQWGAAGGTESQHLGHWVSVPGVLSLSREQPRALSVSTGGTECQRGAAGGTESQHWGHAGRGGPLALGTDPHTSLSTHFLPSWSCLEAAIAASPCPAPEPEPSRIQVPAQLSLKQKWLKSTKQLSLSALWMEWLSLGQQSHYKQKELRNF